MKNKILIIEDDRFLVNVYKAKLSKEGFAMDIAMNGIDGLEKAKTVNPDLILLDLILPKMNGFEVLEELKKDRTTKNIPVLIMSNLGQDNDVEKGRRMGAVDYLIKSDYSISEVVKKIKDAMKEYANP